nr:MAG TPA: hypothetical protein [Caudoviricetes sp.]
MAYSNPHIKGANIYFLKGQKRGKLLLQCVTICYSLSFKYPCNYFICYSLLQFVTIC